MTTEELLRRIVTPSSRLIVSVEPAIGVRVKLTHYENVTRMLASGYGATLHAALVSLDRDVNKGRYGNHVGGE